MPANIVKPGEDGMGIFQRMTGKLKKSFVVPYPFREARIPGQVPPVKPNRNELRAQKDLQQMPNDVTVARLVEDNAPRATVQSVVGNLGLDADAQKQWGAFLEKAVRSSPNELTFRTQLRDKLQDAKMGGELRMALMQRALNHWHYLKKGLVEVLTPDEVLEKAWGRERAGHKYISRKWVQDHWEYEYPDEKKIHVQDNTGKKGEEKKPEPPKSEPEKPKLVLKPKDAPKEQLGLFTARPPAKPKPTQPEPTKPEPVKVEPAKPEPKAEPREPTTEAAWSGVFSIGKWDQLKAAGWTVKWKEDVTEADELDPDKGVGPLTGAKAKQLTEAGLVVCKPKAVEPERPKLVLTEPEAKGQEGLTAEQGEHVWGSRKDKADLNSSADLDELTPEAQAKAVTKKKLLPTWEPEDLLEQGWSPDGVLLRKAFESLIAEKPGNEEARKKGEHSQIYPQGEERTAINRAMAELVKVLAEEKSLEKALKALDYKQGRYFFHAPSANADLPSRREPRGGGYHRRVPKPGGGFKYYYDPSKYADGEKDAHLSGEEAKQGYLHKRVHQAVGEQGKKGAHPKHLAHLVKKHGAAPVAGILRESVKDGKLEFRNGRFFGTVDPEELADGQPGKARAENGNQADHPGRGAGGKVPGKVRAAKGQGGSVDRPRAGGPA